MPASRAIPSPATGSLRSSRESRGPSDESSNSGSGNSATNRSPTRLLVSVLADRDPRRGPRRHSLVQHELSRSLLRERPGASGLFAPGGGGRNCGFVRDRKSTRLNSSHGYISYAVFCLKKKQKTQRALSPFPTRSDHHLALRYPAAN